MHQTAWAENHDFIQTQELTRSIQCDVCIIGGGISGLTTAYHCLHAGLNVVVLEKSFLGAGETHNTSAHLSNALDEGYKKIISLHGTRGAQLAAESHTVAINRIEQISRKEKIDCDFQRVKGYLFNRPQATHRELKDELEAVHQAGLIDVHFVNRAPFNAYDSNPCLCYPEQAIFHPIKYINGLAKNLIRLKGKIYTNTPAVDLHGGLPTMVKTRNGSIVTAQHIVIATNSPIFDRFTMHSKQYPYRTYMIAALLPKDSLENALYWDNAKPYHYIRIKEIDDSFPETLRKKSHQYDLVLIGGEDHKTGQDDFSEKHYKALEKWAHAILPDMKEPIYRWSGQVIEPLDGLAYIGHNPFDYDNIYIITGDSGHGLTHGTIGGILITDLILGKENPWQQLYEPSRLSLKALTTFTMENLNVAAQYGDWFVGGESLKRVNKLAKESGAIFRENLKKVAIYKDRSGNLHKFSAVCPHLGGIVHWNSAEKSWDCPCHGSRFDAYGKVINGPASDDLSPIKEKEVKKKKEKV